MRRLTTGSRRLSATYHGLYVALLWLTAGSSLVAAASVPPGAKEALAPVTQMIATRRDHDRPGIAIRGKGHRVGWHREDLAGSNQDAEHRARKRITNGIHGLVWMILASVIVSTITAIADRRRADRPAVLGRWSRRGMARPALRRLEGIPPVPLPGLPGRLRTGGVGARWPRSRGSWAGRPP